jgi:solute carrier family 25 protein 42
LTKIKDHLIAGGIAGAVAKTVIAPGDRIKILYQVNSDRQFTYRNAFKSAKLIVNNSGFQGLWRGHSSTLMRVVPYSAISFTSYEIFHEQLNKLFEASAATFPSLATSSSNSMSHSSPNEIADNTSKEKTDKSNKNDTHNHLNSHNNNSALIANRFCAGALAGAVATTCTYPLDLMRARMAAHWNHQPLYNNYFDAFKTIISKEGVPALFDGKHLIHFLLLLLISHVPPSFS